MRAVVLPLVMVMQTATAFAQTPNEALQSRVAAALVADIRNRMGGAAVVSVGNVKVAIREGSAGSLAVVPSPSATLDEPVEFAVIGAGTNGRPVQLGRGRADVFVNVPHAQTARTMARGSVLRADDLVDITGDPGGVPLKRLPTVSELVGATLRRDVTGGEVLTLQAAVMPPAVRAGDTVQATASVGGVEAVAELTAIDTGAAGSIVRVVNRDSRRELRARVIRRGVVEVIHD